jgi:hypothetical protein
MTNFALNWLWFGLAAFLAFLHVIFTYNGRTKTQQRRFVYLLWALLFSMVFYCVMALDQLRFTRFDGVTITFGRWILNLITHGMLAAVVVSGISANSHVIKTGFALVSASVVADTFAAFSASENGGNDLRALDASAGISWALTVLFGLAFIVLPWLGRYFSFAKKLTEEAAGQARVQNNFWYSASVFVFALVRAVFTLFLYLGPEGRRIYTSENLQIWLCGAAQIVAIMFCMALTIMLDPSGDTAISGLMSSFARSTSAKAKNAMKKTKKAADAAAEDAVGLAAAADTAAAADEDLDL